jgi:hypothetical protein
MSDFAPVAPLRCRGFSLAQRHKKSRGCGGRNPRLGRVPGAIPTPTNHTMVLGCGSFQLQIRKSRDVLLGVINAIRNT